MVDVDDEVEVDDDDVELDEDELDVVEVPVTR